MSTKRSKKELIFLRALLGEFEIPGEIMLEPLFKRLVEQIIPAKADVSPLPLGEA